MIEFVDFHCELTIKAMKMVLFAVIYKSLNSECVYYINCSSIKSSPYKLRILCKMFCYNVTKTAIVSFMIDVLLWFCIVCAYTAAHKWKACSPLQYLSTCECVTLPLPANRSTAMFYVVYLDSVAVHCLTSMVGWFGFKQKKCAWPSYNGH